MTAISPEAKVGLLVLIGFIILGYMSVQVGKGGFGMQKGYRIEALFDNVAGLNRDSSVQIAGVEVGRVESIILKNGRALVTLRIVPDVKLEKDVRAAIKTHGVLGDKYIDLTPGTSGQGFLAAGNRINFVEPGTDIDKLLGQLSLIATDIKKITGSLSNVVGTGQGEQSLSDIIENTRRLTYNLNEIIVNNQAALHATLENSRDLTGNLNKVVNNNSEKFAKLLDELNKASLEVKQTFASLNEISQGLNRGEGTVGQLLKDNTAADRLNKTLASLQEITDKINQGKGTIGKLVNDEETANNLNEGLTGINRYVTKAEQYRTFLSYRGEFLFRNSDAKSYLDIRMQPTSDKFYILGVSTDPRGKISFQDTTTSGITTHTEISDKQDILFNAQIGKRYKDVAVRGGLFESTGGFGIDYFSLNDNLKFAFEAFDFSKERRAHLKAAAEYRFFKHIYLLAGWDDFLSDRGNSSPFAGLAIRFEDDDIKYLLTTTPIPK